MGTEQLWARPSPSGWSRGSRGPIGSGIAVNGGKQVPLERRPWARWSGGRAHSRHAAVSDLAPQASAPLPGLTFTPALLLGHPKWPVM